MSDRLNELLDKGGNGGQLTPAERDELARLLTAPLLEEPPPFVSKFPPRPDDIPGRIRAIGWFTRCGTPPGLDLTMCYEAVGDWPEAVVTCGQLEWENAQLEAKNQLTFWLHHHAHAEYQEWNRRVNDFKAAVIEPVVRDGLGPVVHRRGLSEGVIQCVRLDLLGVLMEAAYLHTGHHCLFFHELLTVYEAGHFPCGWRGDWPGGVLLVL
jgi:hypothetical protein